MKSTFKYDGREVDVEKFGTNSDGSKFAVEACFVTQITNDDFDVHEMSDDELNEFNEKMQAAGWQ